LDRLLSRRPIEEIGLPAIAREARIPLSSIYHLFPSAEAAYVGLVRRYNAQMDRDLDPVISGAPSATWQDLARALLEAARAFHARHPVVARLTLRAIPNRAVRASDDSHILELASQFATELERRFHIPKVSQLEKRLAIAIAISDRIWSLGLEEDGTVTDFVFEESVRAVLGYLGQYLPPCLELKPESAA
jgi:AcrR family transcriptional regulator